MVCNMPHLPVLLRDTINLLVLKPGSRNIDCTFGDGGHSRAILQSAPDSQLLGIDTDAENIIRAKKQKEFNNKKVILVNDNFRNLKEIALKNNFVGVDAVIMDLGWSSTQFEKSGRGFSFLRDEPLDMRLGVGELTADEILNKWSESEIGKILREYGEERAWLKIAKAIVEYRRGQLINTTGQLVEILFSLRLGQRGKIHPATKTFQALRIAVNDELNALKQALPQAVEILKSGGRLAVISFHSLEDRIVKRFFQSQIKNLKIITKKPIVPSREETLENPRSRSAKLRVAEKI
ncbi:MAG: Ribosomal RNA small subunit methyltransferase H [Candidatus Magasanikbacteria bacterium GW2011_GWC2_41_17]|uniref:Ribosomal RNA small subunit methyltransferase H n=2 Tax=Candidatus Magasanikiibacteriota TaxID=1752731 RepID=A0A0G0WJ64_9BACT|nr:MAG: Ribosomal RNA small subunit methyltransferase H [Candidatus Magasanikbacteria bacterium GW2011_GWC2_41_17]KKS12915.1 MAG: Ribosomal RNA small subunit methyltransferase H [Candidatus Magasanikbacteria bacterium GW2011_GWA2_41_55]